MEIRWSPEADEDFERVVRRTRSDNLTAARKVADRIHTGVTDLKIFPHRGLERIATSQPEAPAPLAQNAVSEQTRA